MSHDDIPDEIMTLSGVPDEEVVCPFSKGRGKKVGDALVFFMLFIAPILFLIAIIQTRLF
jgi:hypothetical protein